MEVSALKLDSNQRKCLEALCEDARCQAETNLDHFIAEQGIVLSSAKIDLVSASDLSAVIQSTQCSTDLLGISQSFANGGLDGQIIITVDHKLGDKLFHNSSELEQLIDLSSLISNTYLNCVSNELDMSFTYDFPKLIHTPPNNQYTHTHSLSHWQNAFAIELTVHSEANLQAALFIVMSPSSFQFILKKIDFLLT